MEEENTISGNISRVYHLKDPSLYINRELSWIQFNRHVLEEAKDHTHPLLERVKFLSIFANNLDEFFMIRVSGLHQQLREGVIKAPPDGLTPGEQLDAIYKALVPLLEESVSVWNEDIVPALKNEGILIHSYETLNEGQKRYLRNYFIKEIFPVLTPLAFDKSHPFPFISNLALNLAVILRERGQKEELFARIKIPNKLFPRLILVKTDDEEHEERGKSEFIFLEEIIAENLDLLFPGMDVRAAYPFRVTRDADIEIEEDEADDLLTAVEESIGRRWVGKPVRIEVSSWMDQSVCAMMAEKMTDYPHMFYRLGGPIGMADLMCLLDLNRPDLKDTPFVSSVPKRIDNEPNLFNKIKARDMMLFHPYESFQPVVQFVLQAAHDPDVLAIKMTLYRSGSKSPVIRALLDARENGKAVSVVVELKARFDEENNIGWAKALEHAGVHVVYGIMGLKVHAKLCLVVRREREGIVRYVHMSSGNYNATTARIYTDIGLFTADPEIASDASNLFNALTGYSNYMAYNHLMVSPKYIRRGILSLIEREIHRQKEHQDGHIILKLNALQDAEMIRALYRASQAGVKINLQIRGICCLRPGIPGVSDNITVTSIVGRFLEHSRIYYFHNGGDEIVLMGSADLMPRNLNRRIEVLFPILDPGIRNEIISTILPIHLQDTVKKRMLRSDGSYIRVRSEENSIHAQEWLISHRGLWNDHLHEEPKCDILKNVDI
ncbi:polyphosphate kinase 1 [Methanospirillum sp. J.3.6.1-F.2.7.3]|jgi:polyphosphate kinase|uniref:Polyphosphate kinase n=1 Tax=Methanospirillum purgamenti TaxID=2834276 RepID=A0A8E7AWH2_9EURY|nr:MULTISPECIES: polyphosphate kinase 1 [Methanospirillum]MDX8550981.1 polyphosphate kinase 1 [Methanospirillum hungatei]QVV87559.1 polyphosphate kinase 1 [Methanospirillum sp. J.3.6.1-F.2.7.3]